MIRENWQWRNISFRKIYTKQEILYFAISYNEISSLTDFIPLGSFYTPWKHQEISSFLMFDVYRLGDWEGIESDSGMELVNILLVLGESVNSPSWTKFFITSERLVILQCKVASVYQFSVDIIWSSNDPRSKASAHALIINFLRLHQMFIISYVNLKKAWN